LQHNKKWRFRFGNWKCHQQQPQTNMQCVLLCWARSIESDVYERRDRSWEFAAAASFPYRSN
jgi:hypothetical protein